MQSRVRAYLDASEVKEIVLAELTRRGMIPPGITGNAGTTWFELGCCQRKSEHSQRVPAECDGSHAPYVIGLRVEADLGDAAPDETQKMPPRGLDAVRAELGRLNEQAKERDERSNHDS